MFAELPKLLDRNFAIAFFLPAVGLTLGCWGVLGAFGRGAVFEALLKRDTLIGAVLAIVLVWLLALLLLALNFPILRMFEGYGRQHPLRWRAEHYRARFTCEAAPALAAQAGIDAARAQGEEPPVPPRHADRLRRAVSAFPDQAEHVLPTWFGNLFRAFEVYPRVVYGLDAIPAWPRLQAVMPEHARKMLADAKAQLDFCVNLAVVATVAALLYAALAGVTWRLPSPWIPILAALTAAGGYRLAGSAAANFGAHVMAAFDLYRGELAKQLGLDLPRSAEAEREMWQAVSRMMIYRSAARAGQLTRFRPRKPGP